MDFDFSEEQNMLRDLAREIIEAESTVDRLQEVEKSDTRFDSQLWKALADANLLGLAVPEAQGGMDFGLIELCILFEELGRQVALVPAIHTLATGGLPITRFGSEEQKAKYLEPMAQGNLILTAALAEGGVEDYRNPGTKAVKDGSSYKLTGKKILVYAGHLASRILVSAVSDEGVGIFLLDPKAEGVTLTQQEVTTNQYVCELSLDGAVVEEGDVLGAGQGAAVLDFMLDAGRVAAAAMQIGVSDKALAMTASHIKERVQFGQPIGSFQAAQHRSADAFIDIQAIRWSTWRAAWSVSEGRESTQEVLTAKFFAADSGSRVANAAQHLHGGIGSDLDYPIHRYFLWAKELELFLGAGMTALVELGAWMAQNTPQEEL